MFAVISVSVKLVFMCSSSYCCSTS